MSNEDIKHALVKKENGVNPFLTVMNFRITFRAWSKEARRRLANAERARARKDDDGDEPASAMQDDGGAKASKIAVEIDVENTFSATSEEDEAPDAIDGRIPMSRSRSGVLGVSMSGSVHGSGSDRASSRKLKKKPKDHLEHFQKKMTVKFQESLVVQRMSSTKKGMNFDMDGREGRNLRASILKSITKRQRALNDLNSSVRSKKSAGPKK